MVWNNETRKNDMGNNSIIEDDGGLWERLTQHQGQPFTTCGRGTMPGKTFTYTIRGGEMLISAKAKTITKATVVMAYYRALQIQETEGYVAGPKKIGTFGASYLYPVFLKLGFITRAPLAPTITVDTIDTPLMLSLAVGVKERVMPISEADADAPLTRPRPSDTIKKNVEEDPNMPRPKGSHNRPKSEEIVETIESIDERIAAAEKAIEILTNDLKSKKAELKALTKLKERAAAVAAAKKAEEDRAAILAAVASSGKTADEIIAQIQNDPACP